MILKIVLLTLIVLLIAILISFVFYILLPSIKNGEITEDPIISDEEKSVQKHTEPIVKKSDKKAFVLCSCNKKFTNQPVNFNDKYTCFMAKEIYDSGSDCKFACIGLGDCVKVCPQEAISIVNKTAVISNLCYGCGKCAEVCPQKIISMIPKNEVRSMKCANTDSNQLTSCDKRGSDEKVEWNHKKDFKIWEYCYKLLKR